MSESVDLETCESEIESGKRKERSESQSEIRGEGARKEAERGEGEGGRKGEKKRDDGKKKRIVWCGCLGVGACVCVSGNS